MKIERLNRTSGNSSTGRLEFHLSVLKSGSLCQKQKHLCHVSEAHDLEITPRMRSVSGSSCHQLTEMLPVLNPTLTEEAKNEKCIQKRTKQAQENSHLCHPRKSGGGEGCHHRTSIPPQ